MSFARLIIAVKLVDVLYELAVQQVQRDMLRTDARAFAAVGAAAGDVERADDVEHVFLKAVGGGLVGNAGIGVVEHALFDTSRPGQTLRHALQRMQRDSSPRQNAKRSSGVIASSFATSVKAVAVRHLALFAEQLVEADAFCSCR